MDKTILETKKIILPNVKIATQTQFLSFVNQYIHTLTLRNKEDFYAQKLNVDLIHKNNSNQQPPFIVPYVKNNIMHIIAYGKEAIKILDYWFYILQKTTPTVYTNYSEIKDTETFCYSNTKHLYTSRNWIAFNKCKYENGFFYKKTKDNHPVLANFNSAIIGNLRTLFGKHNINSNAENSPLKIDILKIDTLGEKTIFLKKGKAIKKHHFSILIETNWQLPRIFFLGQNIGYGNGFFEKL